MRIVYDYHTFSMQQFGGVSRYFTQLASAIDRSTPHEIEIVAPLHINEYLDQIKLGTTRRIIVPRAPGTNRFRKLLSGYLARKQIAKLRGVDILHETFYTEHTVAPKGARRIVTVHDMTHELFPSYFSPRDHSSRAKRAAVDRADHVICVSESTRRDLISLFGTAADKITVVPHGFGITALPDETWSRRWAAQSFILFVGARSGYKNFSALLRAYSESPHLRERFKIVCFGGGPFTASERAELQRQGAEADVLQAGGGDSVLAALYSNAAVFVYPSLYEGFGIPLLEAMSFGCPVACSNTSSFPEVAGDAAAYFDPDADSIRAVLDRILATRSLTQSLADRGRLRILQFSWDQCAKQTADVYERTRFA